MSDTKPPPKASAEKLRKTSPPIPLRDKIVLCLWALSLCFGLIVVGLIVADMTVSNKDLSQTAAYWVQAIGVPAALIVTYSAAMRQVKALREESVRDRGHDELARLFYLFELTFWTARSLSRTLEAHHGEVKKKQPPLTLKLAHKNISVIQEMDLAPFSISRVTGAALKAAMFLDYVGDYYSEENEAAFNERKFQIALGMLAQLSLAIEKRVAKLVKDGAIEPLKLKSARNWNLADNWADYLQDLKKVSPYAPPKSQGDVAPSVDLRA